MTTKPSDWIDNHCAINRCAYIESVVAYLDEQHAAGQRCNRVFSEHQKAESALVEANARAERLEGELDLVHRKLGFAGPKPFPQEQIVAEIARLRSTESTIANRVLDQIYGSRGAWEARLIAIRAKYSAPSQPLQDAQPVDSPATPGADVEAVR